MTPLTLHLHYVVEAGPVVTLLGSDSETGAATTVSIDQRPFDLVWRALQENPEYVGYTAHGLSVTLTFSGADPVQGGAA